MNIGLNSILLILALICFILAAIGVGLGGIGLTALGLAFLTASFLFGDGGLSLRG